jgi:ATPase subunit of ABC transporter with duplicated ATPase domains
VTGANMESDAFYEWLLSDHPDARAERDRRRQAYYEAETQRAKQVQAWAAKIDATPDASEAARKLAVSMGPSAARSRARAEAAIAEPDESYVARERGHWETFMRGSAPNGSADYRYPDRYLGPNAASQPRPEIEPDPEPEAEA